MRKWHSIEAAEALEQLGSSADGLRTDGIPALQEKYGKNELRETPGKSRWQIFLGQFADVMILILAIAAIISFLVGDPADGFVILAIIIANAIIGYIQEYNAEKAVRMLQKMSAQFAMVKRDGKTIRVEAVELVPGDVIKINAGDIIPADARLLQVNSLKTEEAPLTGESHSVDKNVATLPEKELLPGDQLNMVFKGTLVSNGSATAVVTATGMETELGRIAGMLERESPKTPLQKRLAKFSRQLSVVVIIICAAVFGLGMMRGEPALLMFLTALSLAVAALPEALPAVITIALAKGAKRMVRQQALVRKLPAVETLGSVTYICSDKTGTLTQNVMTVRNTEHIEGKESLLRQAMIRNNEVRFGEEGKMLGDSTEIALVRYALENGLEWEQSRKQLPLLAMIPFDSDRMRMSTLHKNSDGVIVFTKGAPGKIAEVITPREKNTVDQWLALNREWAAAGLRVLMFAYKEMESAPGEPDISVENDLHLLGMAAMIDPPREEVINAIRECRTAGIRSVMITGDQPLTAIAIARQLDMSEGEPVAMTGAEMNEIPKEELKDAIARVNVFARVSPQQKLEIVQSLQDNGQFVAMTGDGVNDAPSVKQADIGIAMGITGTDVTKEASDMILLDDNFATIVRAVKTGRRIYDNIRKFILYVLACNLAEILTIFFAPFLGFAIPLLPIHILWINLVTDGLPGLALSNEPAERNIMKKPPRPPGESLFADGLLAKILLQGSLMAGLSLYLQFWAVQNDYNIAEQQTMVFTFLCFAQIAHVMSVRFNDQWLFRRELFSNKWIWGSVALTALLQVALLYVPSLHPVFKTVSPGMKEMGMVLLLTSVCLIGFETSKMLVKRFIPRRRH